MKFTIRGILAATLLVATALHAWGRWNRIGNVQNEIDAAKLAIAQQMFDPEYVAGHTSACRNALKNNPIPSPYFVAASAKFQHSLVQLKKGDP